MGEINSYIILPENINCRDLAEDLGVDRKILLEWIMEKDCGKLWTGCIWYRIGTLVKNCNEYSGFIKADNFLTSWVTVSCSRTTLLRGVEVSDLRM
jgi:hypothetical protein